MKDTASGSMEKQLEEMAAILGLDRPVNERVLKAAVADSTYAHNLLVCRGEPAFMEHLLANPPSVDQDSDAGEIGTGTLVRRAADSLVRWAKTGFSTVTDDIYRKRLAACSACPNLKAPPGNQKVLYAVAGADADQRNVCGKCGCVVTVKARRGSDTCPDAHPEVSGLNRWDEPLVAKPE